MGDRSGNPLWKNGKNGGTPITAESLNNIENVLDLEDDYISGLINNPESAVNSSLKSTYGTRAQRENASALATPSDVGARNGVYDARNSLYVPAGVSLARIRAKLAAVQAGTASSRARIVWVGHSEVSGFGGNPGVNDAVISMRNALSTRYPVGTGCVTAYNANGGGGAMPDARWVFDANWVYAGGGYGSTNIQLHRRAQASGAVATFTSDLPGTIVDIYTFGNTAGFTYSIDGGTATAITPSGSSAVQIITITGLAATTHTVRIVSTSASATYLLGVGVRPAIALEVSNLGFWGSEARDWKPASWYNAFQDAVSISPDLVIVQLDVNEPLHGRTTTQFYDDLTAVVQGYAAASDVALVGSMAPNVSAATWSTYRTKLYDVADAQKVAAVDLTDWFGSNAKATANGIMYDQHHPNGIGYRNSGALVSRLLI